MEIDVFLSEIPLTLEEAFQKSCIGKSLNDKLKIQNVNGCTDLTFKAEEFSPQMTDFKNASALLSVPETRGFKRSISSHGTQKPGESIIERRSSLTLSDVNNQKSSERKKTLQKLKYRKSGVLKMKYISNAMLQEKRVLLVESKHNTPFFLFSILSLKENARISENRLSLQSTYDQSKINQLHILQTNEEVISYKLLLKPSNVDTLAEIDLKKSEWTSGKHRTVLNFEGCRVSVLDYTKPSELKRDLNLKFKNTFPKVEITLSKFRSLERQIQRCAKVYSLTSGVEMYAKSYFERLAFGCVVNKLNRHYVAAICFLLAAKIHGDLKPGEISQLINTLEHTFKIGNILRYEFAVFAALKFSLLNLINLENV